MNVDAKCVNGACVRRKGRALADPVLVEYHARVIRRVRLNRWRAACVFSEKIGEDRVVKDKSGVRRCRRESRRLYLLHAGKMTVGV